MLGVACRLQEVREEEASLLRLAVAREHAVALVGEATLHLARGVVVFLFAVAQEAAVLFALCAPAHAGATVEHAYATAWNHDVELALLNVSANVCRHDDELLALALEGLGVCVCRFVVALAREGELVTVPALAAVTCGNCREGESEVVAAADGKGNLACAGHQLAATADASAAPVGTFGFALVGALPCGISAGVFLPGTAGLAAIPVACGPAASAGAAALVLDLRAAAARLCAAGAALYAAARRRLRAAAGGLGAGRGLFAAAGGSNARNRNQDVAAGRFRFARAGNGFSRELIARMENRLRQNVVDGRDDLAAAVGGEEFVCFKVEEADVVAVGIGDETDLAAFRGEVDEVVGIVFLVVEHGGGDGVNLGVGVEHGEHAHVDTVEDDIADPQDANARIFKKHDASDDVAFRVGDLAVRVENIVGIGSQEPCGRRCYRIFGRFRTRRFVGTVPGENQRSCDGQCLEKCFFHNFSFFPNTSPRQR